jgi:hypothetical protein
MGNAADSVCTLTDLVDQWAGHGSELGVEGDTEKINALLSEELIKLSTADDGWRTLLQHRLTGALWELSYPQAEMHGGGPRRLRQLPHQQPEGWC